MRALRNRYCAVRHGESLANVEGIIVSDPEIGTHQYGLSKKGREQVRRSAEQLIGLCHPFVIVSSDFLRAAETAEILCKMLGADSVRYDTRLRERFFGCWEGFPYTNYSNVWVRGFEDAGIPQDHVESAHAVRKRMLDLIESLEVECSGRYIMLVSHGDPLILLQTAFEDLPVGDHRALPGFRTAEIRTLNHTFSA